MSPPGSTTTPLAMRSVPMMGTDRWSRATVVWMFTTHSARCRTSSTEASTSARPQVSGEELLDPPMGIGTGRGIEGDGGAGPTRPVLVAHIREEHFGLSLHV